MVGTTTGVRLVTGTALVLLLVAGAACSSSKNQTAPPVVSSSQSGVSSRASGPSTGRTATPTAPTTAASGTRPSARSTLPPPAKTPVPPPTPGSTDQTVAPKKVVTKKPVKLNKPSNTGQGVTVRITAAKAITAKAQLPGEVAGPAVALTLVVHNGSPKPIDLGAVVVTLLDSDNAPGNEMSAKPAKPIKGILKSGKSATGVYVFTVGKKRRNPISVDVTLTGEAPVLVFKGNAK
jgi:hypothetical protein